MVPSLNPKPQAAQLVWYTVIIVPNPPPPQKKKTILVIKAPKPDAAQLQHPSEISSAATRSEAATVDAAVTTSPNSCGFERLGGVGFGI